MKERSKLYIETGECQSKVQVMGRPEDILFNWLALSHTICQKLHLTPPQLTHLLLVTGSDFGKIIKGGLEIDLAAMQRAGMEGQP